jgi:hypothetical protein
MKHEECLPADQVIALSDGFYAFVSGKMHGPWPMLAYAKAGLDVEQRRARNAERRKAAAGGAP